MTFHLVILIVLTINFHFLQTIINKIVYIFRKYDGCQAYLLSFNNLPSVYKYQVQVSFSNKNNISGLITNKYVLNLILKVVLRFFNVYFHIFFGSWLSTVNNIFNITVQKKSNSVRSGVLTGHDTVQPLSIHLFEKALFKSF